MMNKLDELERMRSTQLIDLNYIESEEETSFDEEPIEVRVPERIVDTEI